MTVEITLGPGGSHLKGTVSGGATWEWGRGKVRDEREQRKKDVTPIMPLIHASTQWFSHTFTHSQKHMHIALYSSYISASSAHHSKLKTLGASTTLSTHTQMAQVNYNQMLLVKGKVHVHTCR